MTADGFPSNILHKAQIKINSIKGTLVNDFTQGGEGVGLECTLIWRGSTLLRLPWIKFPAPPTHKGWRQ